MFESATKVQKRSSKGFTLIELLVVVVIVGILAAVALPNFLGQSAKARTTEASAAIDATKSGEEAYVNDAGAYLALGTAPTPMSTNTPAYAGSSNAVTGATLASLSGALGVNLDTNRFTSGTAGARWAIATAATTTSNFVVVVSGGASPSTTTNQVAGLAASYQKTNGKVWLDSDSTQ
jgi:type IV pilus assembly protein PilA